MSGLVSALLGSLGVPSPAGNALVVVTVCGKSAAVHVTGVPTGTTMTGARNENPAAVTGAETSVVAVAGVRAKVPSDARVARAMRMVFRGMPPCYTEAWGLMKAPLAQT